MAAPHRGHMLVAEFVGAEFPQELWLKFIGSSAERKARAAVLEAIRSHPRGSAVSAAVVAVAVRAFLDRLAPLEADALDRFLDRLAGARDEELDALASGPSG